MATHLKDEKPQSSLWSCVILKDNCKLFNTKDPHVFYFVLTAFVLYFIFLFIIFADLKYWWSLDNAQQQIFHYVESLKCKLRNVQTQQRHMKECHSMSEKYFGWCGSVARLLRAARAGGSCGGADDGGCDRCSSVDTVTDLSLQRWTSSPSPPPLGRGPAGMGGDSAEKDDAFCVI